LFMATSRKGWRMTRVQLAAAGGRGRRIPFGENLCLRKPRSIMRARREKMRGADSWSEATVAPDGAGRAGH
jgi:hypothetical protein